MRAMTVVRADCSWDREGILETLGAMTSANGGSGVDEGEGVRSGGRERDREKEKKREREREAVIGDSYMIHVLYLKIDLTKTMSSLIYPLIIIVKIICTCQ